MDSVAKRDPEDSAKIKAIEQKLLANPEIAKLIDALGTTATDANDLVRGLLQASVTRGLEAEMDAHLGYSKGDREAKAAGGGDNYRNGSYVKKVDSNYGPVDVTVVKSARVVFLPFVETSSVMVSGTGTCLVLCVVHATSLVVSASMTLAVINALVCSRLVSDM